MNDFRKRTLLLYVGIGIIVGPLALMAAIQFGFFHTLYFFASVSWLWVILGLLAIGAWKHFTGPTSQRNLVLYLARGAVGTCLGVSVFAALFTALFISAASQIVP